MKILIIGSGGREHALAWKIAQSPKVKKIFCAPGNAGTADIGENVDIKADDINGLLDFAIKEGIDLTIVGPEAPLVQGITDLFKRNGLKIFGPSGKAAQLEKSKIFAKRIMTRYGIPTAKYMVFKDADKAKEFVKKTGVPIVIKADGLALGKGVTVCQALDEAYAAIDDALVRKVFGVAGDEIIIEEALVGEEASILAVSDGKHSLVLETSQDHKRIFDNDKGPNTGGMGAYSPAPVVTKELFDRITKEVIEPTIQGMAKEGMSFTGILYAGIMVTKDGPKVLEYNVRFGDPEAEAILPRLKSDIVDIILAAIDGKINKITAEWHGLACVSVVMASGGYPGDYAKGKAITGLDFFRGQLDTFVFHAGTRLENGKVVTSGGRVLNVVGLGPTIKSAIDIAYQSCGRIKFDGMQYRRDIGYRAINSKSEIRNSK